MEKVLYVMIGGRGFLGTAFSNVLENKGGQLVYIDRNQLTSAEQADELAAELRLQTYTRFIVVDFAYSSVPHTSFANPVKDYSENLYNLLHHIRLVRKLPRCSYIYISSGGTVYGDSRRKMPISEKQEKLPLSPYGITKLACEHYILMYRQIFKLDVKIIRPSNIYGPGQKPFRGQGIIATFAALMLQQMPIELFGDGSIVRDYVYIDDLCSAISDIITFGKSGGIYNVGSGVGVSINELLAKLRACTNTSTVEVNHSPSRPFDVKYNVLNSAKLRALNNWNPQISLDEGLKRTAAWLSETQGIATQTD